MTIELSQEKFPEVDPLFLEIGNDYSPIGNDTGADILANYEVWRSNDGSERDFLDHQLKLWGVNSRYWEHSDEDIQKHLEKDHFSLLTKDDACIAVAFSQYFIDGKIDYVIKRRALISIDRQMKDVVINFRGWASPQKRKESLLNMKTFIETAGIPQVSKEEKPIDGMLKRIFRQLFN